MDDLLAAGKIRQWGVSNMDVAEMDEIFAFDEGRCCAVNQILYNLSRRGVEYDLLPWCENRRLAVMAYSPVEQGRILNDAALRAVAQRHNASPAQIALAWVLQKPGVTAIPKAGKMEHVKENARSASIVLTLEDVRDLDTAFPPPGWKVPLEIL
jgi:diketogulonate reductase-like aldo/keto reductase